MSAWSGVHGSETDAISTFARQAVPDLLDFVCLRNRIAPPAAEGAAYCDLGCGDGFSATLIAAANPRLSVTGIDPMPSCVAAARHLAADAGLHNLAIEEASFGEAASGLPAYDYVVLQGAWSSAGPEARADLVRFLLNRVKPGGIVYSAYDALPGAAAALPARALLRRLYAAARGMPEARAAEALALVRAVAERGAWALKPGDAARSWLDALSAGSLGACIHEIGAPTWQPVFHDELAAALQGAKLSYVGSADILDDLESLVFDDSQRDILATVPEPALKAVVKDTILDTSTRKDVFIRGARRLGSREWAERLLEIVFVPALAPRRMTREPVWRGRTIAVDKIVAERMSRALAAGPQRLGDLLRGAEFEDIGLGRLLEHATVLIASGAIMPLVRPRDAEEFSEAIAATRRLNARLLERAAEAVPTPALAAPLLGGGVELDRLSQLFVRAVVQGEDPARSAADALARKPGPEGEAMLEPAAIARQGAEFSDHVRPFLAAIAVL